MGRTLIDQTDAFLCAAKSVFIGIHFKRKIMTGMFGGEGFIMRRVKGDSCIIERKLEAGEELHIDTGCITAMTSDIDFDTE